MYKDFITRRTAEKFMDIKDSSLPKPYMITMRKVGFWWRVEWWRD